ncbi:hypothetical protein FBU30_001175 [Linnemannia zychae]|nr:hypothetical protein FBU30_001175 [Linnemannia zychae]
MTDTGSRLPSRPATSLSAIAQSSSTAGTDASTTPSTSPSLAQLAANSNAPPRRSLASLATPINSTSSTATVGTGSPSLSDLAASANQGLTMRRSLASLAHSSATPTSTTQLSTNKPNITSGNSSLLQLASASDHVAPQRRSLASLATSSTTPTTATQISTTLPNITAKDSSLSQLASASNHVAPQRRSLASLATSSTITPGSTKTNLNGTNSSTFSLSSSKLSTTQQMRPATTAGSSLNRSKTVGLTLSSGGSLTGISRSNPSAHDELPRDTNGESPLPSTLSSTLAHSVEGEAQVLTSGISVSKLTAPSIPNMSSILTSKSDNGSKDLSLDTSSTTNENVSIISGSYVDATIWDASLRSSINKEMSQKEPMSPEAMIHNCEVGETRKRQAGVPAFSSLIAPPSQFAISIFEKLVSPPSTLALSKKSHLQFDSPLIYVNAGEKMYSMTPRKDANILGDVKAFAFDIPSPDDTVFKAQGQRPLATRT